MVEESLIREILHVENQQLIRELSVISKIEQFQKGQDIFEIGKKPTHFYILLQGIVYTYFLNEKQQQNTTCFFSEKYDFLNVEGIGEESRFGASALVNTEICMISVEKGLALSEQYPDLIWCYMRILQKMMIHLCAVNNQRIHLSAEESYQWFCSKWPEIDHLANNQQIASFLRIQPESLSRLRARIRRGKKAENVIVNVPVSKDLQWDYMDVKQKIIQI